MRRGDAFVIEQDSQRLGEITWTDRDGVRFIDHTWVAPTLRGQGVALRLVERAVALARADRKQVVPSCSYVRAALDAHPELADVLNVPSPRGR